MGERCYRVLALDGGGIRGLIGAEVLREVEATMGRPISALFDLVAGTSTGGILALGLTVPGDAGGPRHTAADMCELYLNSGRTIFGDSLRREAATLHGLLDAKYSAAPLERVLAAHFGTTMLSEALTEVVVPSYDLTAPGPFFFKREYAAAVDEDWDVPMTLVARATSAAPTLFDPAVVPGAEVGGDHALVDGGTFANDPALAGYVDALRLRRHHSRVCVVSIGTGLPPQAPGSGPIPLSAAAAARLGLLRWARPILEVVLDGVPKAVEYQLRALQAARPDELAYFRLQSELPTASHALDDASAENCRRLVADARSLVAANRETLEQIYAELV